MKIEDVKLDIKEILLKKGVYHTPQDVARLRFACSLLIEVLVMWNREKYKKC